ncbi:YqaJ viral recombinase family protein [Thiocystis violacea]|uniref:YqaJ viral recombinase family nuclease n=1 Tax=Thiocystis violacea TaxID=13725 RepID=UPI0019083B11|nr:YqaJ viral recombinase family protein [Thiocystis violacea]MBK1720116.1 endonuclease [Thiocystis violacea]
MLIINLSQRSPEWLAWRAQGVTASEAAILVGRSPYKTTWRLWAEKTGLCAPDDLSNHPLVQRGLALEDMARQGFEARHATLLLPVCAEFDDHPVLRCSFDGISDQGEPVELKVPAPGTWDDIAAHGTTAKAYQLYWVQVQFQMLVAGAERGWLVFDPQRAGVSALEFEIVRDAAFLSELVPTCLAFHEAVRNQKEPIPDPTRDLFVPVGEDQLRWTALATKYRDAETIVRRMEDELKAFKSQMADAQAGLVDLMGEFLLADRKGVRVLRYRQMGSVDYPALLAEVAPDLAPAMLNAHRRGFSDRVKVTAKAVKTVQADTIPTARTQRQTPGTRPVKIERAETQRTRAAVAVDTTAEPEPFGYF